MKKITLALLAVLLVTTLAVSQVSANNNGRGNNKDNGSANCATPSSKFFFASRLLRHWYNFKKCTPDTVAPIISNIVVSDIGQTNAKISWTTSEKATTEVQFGTTSAYTNSVWSRSLGTSHSETIKNLQPNTAYHYQVIARDFWGNRSVSVDGSFTTSSVDTSSPAISNISVSLITENSAKVSFTSNEPTQGVILFGGTSAYGLEARDEGKKTSHEIFLSNLSAGTTYHFMVQARDINGNLTSSADSSFMTLVASPELSISGINVTNINNNSVRISWQTNVAARGSVLYGSSTAYGQTAAREEYETNHAITIGRLTAGTQYHYQIRATDRNGRIATSTDMTLTTTGSDVRSPVISRLAISDIGTNSVVISFKTDENASTKIHYGTIDPVMIGTAAALSDSNEINDHRMTLTGLSANTTYYFVIESRDASGNVSISTQQTFRTQA
jgi:phosphodiesterase/alkaline phosphatase D-like protein